MFLRRLYVFAQKTLNCSEISTQQKKDIVPLRTIPFFNCAGISGRSPARGRDDYSATAALSHFAVESQQALVQESQHPVHSVHSVFSSAAAF